MHEDLLEILRCPTSGQKLVLSEAVREGDAIISGKLTSADGHNSYNILRGVPRFAPMNNYTDNFGKQWNLFKRTQLDSYTGFPISAERFWKATSWSAEEMKNKLVLDAGCGAGRFAEIAAQTKARLIAIDYSSAVDAAKANLTAFSNVDVVQADIYALPFEKSAFDYVYSLGVLQHTPDVKKATLSLISYVRPGGRFCADYYLMSFAKLFHPKYYFRPVTRHLDQGKLFAFLERWVPRLLPISIFLQGLPGGRALKRLVPVANYAGVLPLNPKAQLEWSILDTFDWYAPRYDQPQTPATIRAWLARTELEEIEVFRAHHLIGRGTKPRCASN